MLLSKRILFAINYNGPAHLLFLFFLYQKTEFTRIHSHSRALYIGHTRERNSLVGHTTDYTSSKSTIEGSRVAIVGQIYPLIHGFSRP